MKRFVAITLWVLAVFALTFLSVTSALALETPTITCADTDCYVGDTVTVQVQITDNPGITYLAVTPTFSEELGTPVVSNGEVFAGLIEDTQLIWASGSDNVTDGLLVSFTFELDETIAPGEYTVGFSACSALDSLGSAVSFEIVSATVTVSAKPIVTWIVDGNETTEAYAYGETPEFKGETAKAATAQYTYTFDGWDKELEPVTEDVTYTAQYTETLNTYTVTWIVDGVETPEEYDYGATPEFNGTTDKAADAQYTYEFDGWDNEITAVTENVTYTATYTETVNTYTVTWIVDGNETTEDYDYGEIPVFKGETDKADTEQYTYEFDGWDVEIATVTEDVTYTAQYTETLRKYTVTWVVGGTEIPEEYDYGATPEFKGETDKAADAQYTYEFDDWDKEFVTVTEDATYTAIYTETLNTYTVTWVVDGVEIPEEYDYGSMPEFKGETDKAADAQYTYEFDGWDVEITTVTEDVTYTAKYIETLNQYTVTWIVDGVETTEDYDYGEIPVFKGETDKADTAQYTYEFDGWDVEIATVTENVTYTAQYTETLNTYTVTWVVDGVEIPEEYDYGATPEFKGETAKAATAQYTYTFDDWDKELETVTEDVTYTAQYTETLNRYTVTYQDYDGTELYTVTVDYGTSAAYEGDEPERKGDETYTYTFVGWDTDTSFIAADTTVTAVYSDGVNTFAVTWIVDGKVFVELYDIDATPEFKGDTDKAATAQYTYEFDGWDAEITTVTENVTYTAVYNETLNKYTVTWIVDGVETPEDYDYGEIPVFKGETAKEATAQYTYEFDGWDIEIATVTEDVTYTAKYIQTLNQYTVTWIVDGNETTEDYDYGETPEFKGETAKAADAQYTYEFDGWNIEIVTVTEDVTYTAKYTETLNKYTVTWIVDGVETTEDYDYGATPEFKGETAKAATAQYTYEFDGWDAEITTVTENVTYTAVYNKTLNKYTVTWIVDGNETTEDYDYGATPEFKGETDKASEGNIDYAFDGWDKDITTVTEDVTYTAEYSISVKQRVVKLTNTDFVTAWGLQFSTEIKATQIDGVGSQIVLTYDPLVVTYQSHKAVSGVSVTVEGNSIKISSFNVTDGQTLVTLTFTTSNELASGEYDFISVGDKVNTADFSKLKIYQVGDVNLDGNVNSRDVTMIKQYVVKMINLSDAQKVYANAYADYDNTGAATVSSRDATIITQYVVKMPVTLGDRVEVTFVNDDDTQIKRTVRKGAELLQIPEANAGYAWSGSKTAFIAPVYANITQQKIYYLIKITEE